MIDPPIRSTGGASAALAGNATLDLTAFGLPPRNHPCQIQCDPLGRPEAVVIELPNTDQLLNVLTHSPGSVRGQVVTVALGDGRELRTRLQMFSGLGGGDGLTTVSARFHIADSEIAIAAPHDGAHWRIRLTNIYIRRGDNTIKVPHEKGFRLLHGNVAFQVAGRNWNLTDTLEQQWREIPTPDKSKPLLSGCLETRYQTGDSHEAVTVIIEEIEALLRVALCRDISWITCELIASGKVVKTYYSSRGTKPFEVGGSEIISNDVPRQLKTFLEAAHPRFVADREWFMVTSLLYAISRLTDRVEVRTLLQNTLLDRMAAKVLEKDDAAEIDAEMPTRMTKVWQGRLHNLMLEASPYWSQVRTNGLVGNIKTWNQSPSFPGGVERAAIRLGLWPPSKRHIAKRHKLVHLGEYDDEDGVNVFDYWLGIECVVTMMLLRMLGYSGAFYHLALGRGDKLLGDLLIGGKESPPYQFERTNRVTDILAHRLWVERGKPFGDDWTDWFVAEKTIQSVLAKVESTHASKQEKKVVVDDSES